MTFVKLFYVCLILSTISLVYAQSASVSIEPLDWGIKQAVVTLSNTSGAIPTTALSGRKSMIIKNLDTVDTVYLGASDVTADETSTGGYPLSYYESFQADIGENNTIYGIISGTGSAKVVVKEIR